MDGVWRDVLLMERRSHVVGGWFLSDSEATVVPASIPQPSLVAAIQYPC